MENSLCVAEDTLCVAPVGQRKAQQLNFSYFTILATDNGPD